MQNADVVNLASRRGVTLSEHDADLFVRAREVSADPNASTHLKNLANGAVTYYSDWLASGRQPNSFNALLFECWLPDKD